MKISFDVLIIGSGLASLTTALSLADQKRVAIITKAALLDGASAWAQGGISAVLDAIHDDFEQHVQDTLEAGAGLCRRDVVEAMVHQAPEAIAWLIDKGVCFTKDQENPSGYHLTREGGHSQRRVIHAQDATGRVVQQTLEQLVRTHPNIHVYEHHHAIDLITAHKMGLPTQRVLGAYVLNKKTDEVAVFSASCTVLATGGAGKVYVYTTNPDTATGDGIAMAWRVGARVANLEFIQFHPTCLYHAHGKPFLISEAVRGEGAYLLDAPNGRRFMLDHDPRAELAPRDIVARAIDFEMKKQGLDCVFLDITHQSAKFIRQHFPNIYEHCKSLGIDMTHEPVPVVPAAHYTCGGVVVDSVGRTDVAGLYAVGEVACTGLHGANRLASNSLLECVVMGRAAARNILDSLLVEHAQPEQLLPWDHSQVTEAQEEITIAHNWDELRRVMWNYVGIVRTTKRLKQAQKRIDLLKEEIQAFYAQYRISSDLLELRNLVLVADLIVQCALLRHESRGLHANLDYPNRFDSVQETVLEPVLG